MASSGVASSVTTISVGPSAPPITASPVVASSGVAASVTERAAGSAVGASVGSAVGASVGSAVGASVGSAVGASVGSAVGASVGSAVGASVGSAVTSGVAVGAGVSDCWHPASAKSIAPTSRQQRILRMCFMLTFPPLGNCAGAVPTAEAPAIRDIIARIAPARNVFRPAERTRAAPGGMLAVFGSAPLQFARGLL